jgi:hypothetical protein
LGPLCPNSKDFETEGKRGSEAQRSTESAFKRVFARYGVSVLGRATPRREYAIAQASQAGPLPLARA